jgi:AcrR family transcriptional regulator
LPTRISKTKSNKVQKPQAIDSTRRKPKQRRAEATRAAIFEATAQIIESAGRRALTTNRIAERAGVSIGALYQYFANKEAILIEMARAQLESDRIAIMSALSESISGAAAEPERLAIRALISVYEKRRRARRAVTNALIAEGLGHERSSGVRAIAEMIAARGRELLPQLPAPPSEMTIFVITRAINGVLRSTIEEDSRVLGSGEFEDELVRLVRCYLIDSRGKAFGSRGRVSRAQSS